MDGPEGGNVLLGFLAAIRFGCSRRLVRPGWRGGSARRGRTPGTPDQATRRHTELAALTA